MTENMPIHNGRQRLKIGFTDQRLCPHAGLSSFAGFLHRQKLKDQLEALMPLRTSPNAQPAADLALGFVVGVLAGAKKLAQVGFLRADPVFPSLLGIDRMPTDAPAVRISSANWMKVLRCPKSVWKSFTRPRRP